jgi:hypothetical protein
MEPPLANVHSSISSQQVRRRRGKALSIFSGMESQANRRKKITNSIFIGIGALVAYEAAQYVLSEDYHGAVYALGAVFGAAVVVIILNDWRKGIYLFFTWLLFEDFVRKFMGNNMAIYFAKDVLFLFLMLSFFVDCRRRKVRLFRPPFMIFLALFVWLGILQVFNPASPHVIFGLMGLKLYYLYMPLLFAGYALFESEAGLRSFFWWNLIVADIIAGLGIAQSILGHTFLNPEFAADDLRELSTLYRTAPVSGVVVYRPTSVFVSDGRFASYMTLSLLLAFGFAGYLLLRSKKGRVFSALSVAVIAVAAVLSASRGAFMWCIIDLIVGSLAFLWGAPWKQRQAARVVRAIFRTAAVIAAGLVILLLANPDALLGRVAFYSETLLPSSSGYELGYRTFDYPLLNFITVFQYPKWPYGYGIGTESLGVQYVARFFKVQPPIYGVENGYGTLILEFGVLGLVIWILMTFSIIKACANIVVSLRGSPWFPIAFVIAWYAFLLLFPFTIGGMVSYQNFTVQAFLWLLIGILFRLPKLSFENARSQIFNSSPRPDGEQKQGMER